MVLAREINALQVFSETVLVTPELAELWLKSMIANRRPSKAHVKFLASMMRRGQFRTTHQGVAFDWFGRLIDGQHRLLAIIEAGIPQQMIVTRNLDPETMLWGDQGRNRRAADFGGMGKIQAALARNLASRVFNGGRSINFISNEDVVSSFKFHHDAIEFVMDNLMCGGKIKGITTAVVGTPVARAWYSEDRERLAKFCLSLREMRVSSPSDSAPILLGRFLLGVTNAKNSTLDVYFKTERAIRAYLDFENISKLYSPTEELFPIPEMPTLKTAA